MTFSKNGTKILSKSQIIAKFPLSDSQFRKFIEELRIVFRQDYGTELFYYMKGVRGYKIIETKEEALMVKIPLKKDIA